MVMRELGRRSAATGLERTSRADRLEAETLGLRALAFVVADTQLGPRFLELTGLSVEVLRTRAGERALLAATLEFLERHEPSLVACAGALDVTPDRLVVARTLLD